MKARKYRFESESIAAPLIAGLTSADKHVVINGNPDFAIVPAMNPDYNVELPTNPETNYPFMEVAFAETKYCVDVLWASEPLESWSTYEIKVPISPLMIHKFDKFDLTQDDVKLIANEYILDFNITKFGITHIMSFLDKADPIWEIGVVDNISSIHNNTQAVVGDNSYSIGITVFDKSEKTVTFNALLTSSNTADRFYLYKYNTHADYLKKENAVNIFTLAPGEEVSSSVNVENLNMLEFRYTKAEGGQATDKVHIKSVLFA